MRRLRMRRMRRSSFVLRGCLALGGKRDWLLYGGSNGAWGDVPRGSIFSPILPGLVGALDVVQ